ncbi:MAG TPA: hypothetical protein VJ829_07415 [Candidatus Binatia bacterium]|nr:hypothetical protein [Candidatus Binatia bacterium]
MQLLWQSACAGTPTSIGIRLLVTGSTPVVAMLASVVVVVIVVVVLGLVTVVVVLVVVVGNVGQQQGLHLACWHRRRAFFPATKLPGHPLLRSWFR